MALAVYNVNMETLVGIDVELKDTFEKLDRMMNSSDKLTDSKSVSFHKIIRNMKKKLVQLKIAVELNDFLALKVITQEYLKDVDKLMAEI